MAVSVITNSANIWNPTNHGTISIGTSVYQTETNGVLGFYGWPAANGFVNAKFIKFSSTLWYDTNNTTFSILTNGSLCIVVSNVTAIAFGSTLTTMSIISPGSGAAGTVVIGSVIDETTVNHIGLANYQQFQSGSYQDSTGLFPAATNLSTIPGGVFSQVPFITGVNTNFLISSGATMSSLNSGWAWDASFTAASGLDVGGYTNIGATEVEFFDSTIFSSYVLAPNPPDMSGLVNVWFSGPTASECSIMV